MNKKLLACTLLLTLALTFAVLLAGCKDDGAEVKIYVPDGAPALAVTQLLSLGEIDGAKINITITTGLNVQSKVSSGEADAVICPTNMAANLYNKGAEYKLVTVNLFGLLYLVGNADAVDLNDFKGQVVHTIGKNNTPEFVFKKILSAANIEYVDSDVAVENKVALRYYETAATILPLLKSNVATYAILGEPAATNSGAKELFDLQELWKQATNLNESYPQAGLFVSDALLKNSPELVKSIVNALKGNVEYLSTTNDNVAQILENSGSNDFKGKTLTTEILNRCNVRCVYAIDCKAQLTAYFQAIKTVNNGFTLPNDGFYANIL